MRNIIVGLTVSLSIGAGASTAAQVFVEVPSNGVLKGYTVQQDGKTVCRDPEVWNQFRGPDSYIVCP